MKTSMPVATPTADVRALLRHAVDQLRQDDNAAAEQALLSMLQAEPQEPDALHFLGVLRHQQGHSEAGIALIRQSLALQPANAGAWNNLGNVLVHTGALDDAVQAYEQVIAAGHEDSAASAWSNLGAIHLRQGRPQAAEAACRQAVERLPDFAEAWYNLSLALMRQGRISEGLHANSRAITLWPQHLQARDQVLRALLLLGERERAAAMYREWLAEDPGNVVVQHQLAACLGKDPPPRASDAYVREVFDSFAQSFDAKLEALHYRAPPLVAQALADAAGPPAASLDIVDAGCGTGLCGPLLRPWARHLAGCDLSVGMLRRAVPRKVYDVLHQAELVYYMDTQPGRFDAVVSADTLIYFGDLQAVFTAARKCLKHSGWLVFTLEALAEDDAREHMLQANGRYAHSRRYIEGALRAADLALVAVASEVLRSEAGQPVAGWVVTGRRG